MINPIAFSVFSFDIYWYGVAYVMSFVFSFHFAKYYIKKFNLGLTFHELDSVFIFIVWGILIGGRLGCFLFYEEKFFTKEIFMLREGGMSFHGGFLGVIFAIFVWSRLYCYNSYWTVLDLVATISPIGIFFVRVTNYINQEISGKIFFQMEQPAVLYEAFFEGIILFFILNLRAKHNFKDSGKNSRLFLIYYGLFRFFLEFLKDDAITFFFLNTGQILCLVMIIVGILLKRK